MVETACKRCGVVFTHSPSQERVFCGRQCYNKARLRDVEAANKDIDPLVYKAMRACQRSADYRSIPWELSYDDCKKIFSLQCYLCGVPGPSGIDRLDSTKGYIRGNVAPCCTECNLLKGSIHVAPFLRRIRQICKHTLAQGYFIGVDSVRIHAAPRAKTWGTPGADG